MSALVIYDTVNGTHLQTVHTVSKQDDGRYIGKTFSKRDLYTIPVYAENETGPFYTEGAWRNRFTSSVPSNG